jgi:glycosyltransferase involved in cell wall biosynthesis
VPAKNATLVITDSEHAKARIIDTLGIAPERVEAILLGIDHDLFHPAESDDGAALKVLGLPDRFIVYPAGIWPHKNHERLVDALALLEDPEITLILTGPTFGALSGVVQRARLRRVEDRVRHLGFVSPQQLAGLYRAAEALVFPSLYEGFGAPPLEAMACGCPVATSVDGSLGEVCGDAAAVFDARSPESIAHVVDRLLCDGDLRQRLRARGLAWAKRFTWRMAAERHVAAYERAVRIA